MEQPVRSQLLPTTAQLHIHERHITRTVLSSHQRSTLQMYVHRQLDRVIPQQTLTCPVSSTCSFFFQQVSGYSIYLLTIFIKYSRSYIFSLLS